MRIIRGKYGRRRFDVPTNITARPTTDFARENIFNVIENYVDLEGLHALDLFAGTGAVSFEFLSRECASVTAVESRHAAALHPQGSQGVGRQQSSARMRRRPAIHRFSAEGLRCGMGRSALRYARLRRHTRRDTQLGLGERRHSGNHRAQQEPRFLIAPGFREHRAYGSVNFSIFVV